MDSFQQFHNKLASLKFDPNEKIAVAVSGGSDSMALCLLANDYFTSPITAITVDHGLRSESNFEALQVGTWLKKRNIQHEILKWEGEKPTSNIQSEARNARYDLMAEYCNEQNIKYLFVAHNKNDQAETLLMRLMRGSGIKGLSSIKELASFNKIQIVRPLLGVSKHEIKTCLKKLNQKWVEDPSNKNEKYERVRVRNILNNLDDSDLFIDRLAKTASHLQRSSSYIDKKIQQDQEEVCQLHKLGYATIKRQEFVNLHNEAKYKILSNIIKKIGGSYYNTRFEKLDYALSVIENSSEFNTTLGRCEIYSSKKKSEQNIVYVTREIYNLPAVKINHQDKVFWDNRFTINTQQYANGSIIRPMNKSDILYLQESGKIRIDKSLNKKIYYSLPIINGLNGNIFSPLIELES